MLTVGADPSRVESLLAEGTLACPGCGGGLAGWGHARRRVVRRLEAGIRLVLRPRQARPAADPRGRPARRGFKWEETRTVDKTCLISAFGNYYQVDPALRRRRVQIIFDPFHLEEVEVRHGGRSYGTATVFTLSRHADPKARPEQPGQTPPEPTGLDYSACWTRPAAANWPDPSTTPPCSPATLHDEPTDQEGRVA